MTLVPIEFVLTRDSSKERSANVEVIVVDLDELKVMQFTGVAENFEWRERPSSAEILAEAEAIAAALEGRRWAAFSDDELAALERALGDNHVIAHARPDWPNLFGDVSDELKRRGAR